MSRKSEQLTTRRQLMQPSGSQPLVEKLCAFVIVLSNMFNNSAKRFQEAEKRYARYSAKIAITILVLDK